jgi:hypothetical protein
LEDLRLDYRIVADVLWKKFSKKACLPADKSGHLWYPVVMEGEGRLCGGDTVKFVPGTPEDVANIVNPKTSATDEPAPCRKSVALVPGEKDRLEKLQQLEMFMYWDQFKEQIIHDNMIHIVTDGGARPNPGHAGCGGLIMQNKKVTWFWGHYDKATNNAMELRAVVEMLNMIPERMHVWISTDSAYVKRGITECMGNWTAKNWRTAQDTPVANREI